MASKDIYYVPHGSKWPLVGSLALFTTFIGGGMLFNDNPNANYVLLIGAAAVVYMFVGWFND